MRLSLWQAAPRAPGETLERVVDRLAGAAREARAAAADLLVAPEMMLSGYAIGAEAMGRRADEALAEGWEAVAALARETGIALAVGGPDRGGGAVGGAAGGPAGAVLNTARLYAADGTLAAAYAKAHLFGDLDRAQFAAGDRLGVTGAIGATRCGLAICYDIEFPEAARALVAAGADAMLVPTANMEPYDSVNTRLVPARAEENTTPVVYANYAGREADLTYCGLSCIVGPTGEDLARAGRTGEAVITATLDPAATAAARARITYLADRRPALYRTQGGANGA
ncbi:MAG: nitrilase-related carbon-nitrogen hydrolase [Pseudomonadota bacterium]